MRETDIQQAIRVDLGREPDLVLWRNHVGVANVDGRVRRFGLCNGSSDLVGIGPGGRFFALEVKSNNGRLDSKQSLFIELVKRRGGFAAVVRSVADARAALNAARRGESWWEPNRTQAA